MRAGHLEFLVAKLGDGARAQPQLHGVSAFDFDEREKQQPAEHALHIFELDVKGPVQKHRALNPLGAQVQVTDLTVF